MIGSVVATVPHPTSRSVEGGTIPSALRRARRRPPPPGPAGAGSPRPPHEPPAPRGVLVLRVHGLLENQIRHRLAHPRQVNAVQKVVEHRRPVGARARSTPGGPRAPPPPQGALIFQRGQEHPAALAELPHVQRRQEAGLHRPCHHSRTTHVITATPVPSRENRTIPA